MRQSTLDLLLLCWVALPLLLLTLSAGKRMVYLLALYPAAALLLAPVLAAALAGAPSALGSKSTKVIWVVQGAITSLILVYAWKVAGDVDLFASLWLAPLLIGTMPLLYFWWRYRALPDRQTVSALVAAVALGFLTYGGALQVRLAERDSLESLFADLRDLPGCCNAAALYRPLERVAGAAYFSLNRSLPELGDLEEAREFMAARQQAYLVSSQEELLALGTLTGKYHIGGRDYFIVSKQSAP